MDTPVVIDNDAGIIRADDEIEIENTESTPSAAKQEVNKPSDEAFDTVKKGESDRENDNLNARTEPPGSSPKKAMKRNVSFPPESPVTSCLDPPDPWKNVPNWKTEDLLRAYKMGCEKHGTKPVNKIVQQLSCIENVGERYEILSLKGERLDIRQSESLEEIFKHVRFRCIDLEATHLDDETSVAIFDMVEYYESACKLNISFNKNIGPRGWQACSKLIRKTPCLTFIDAKNCDLNERVMPILGRSLRMGCFLTRLHLQSVGLAGRALVILVAALKMNETLKELFIGDNKLMSTDGVQVGNLLKFNHKLELLDLRNNHLQDVGAHHVCEGLSEQTYGSGLLTLVLWNNQISFQAMSDISHALIRTDSLETLNLGHNPITNEGIHLVKDGLLKSKSLLKLGLSGTKVTCEGAVALAEVIADTSRIVRLDLQENDIKTAGLMALSLALKVNKSMSRLDLDKDTKKEQGIKDYAEQQRRLQQDVKTYLERNRDLAHKQVREHDNVSKVENKAFHEPHAGQAKVSTEEGVLVGFELNGNNEENEMENGENELKSAEHSYIPSEDRISRPKLLFLHDERSPESDLESPESVSENFSLMPSLEQQEMLTLALPSASGQDLLSPQYCPKMTARKLFSVTRVTSPTLAPPTNPLLDTKNQSLSVPHLCTPLSSVPVNSPVVSSLTIETLNLNTSSQVEVDSCLIQQKLALETYLQDLVNPDGGPTEIGAKNDETGKESIEVVEKHSEVSGADKTVNTQDETVKSGDADIASFELDANKAESDSKALKNDLEELLQDGGHVDNESGLEESVNTKTAELGGQKVCEENVVEVNRLSAGDGPTRPDCNEIALVDDDSFIKTVSNYANDSSVSDESFSKSVFAEYNTTSSQLVSGSAFEINDRKYLSASEVDDVTVDNVCLKPESASVNENSSVIADDCLSVDHIMSENSRQLEETNVVVSESNLFPTSVTPNASDDQLDSIEIIPESDIDESKCVPDLNEEIPEFLDCDSSDDITNNAYLGLTDSLCDLVLPFELENGNTTEDATVNSLTGNKHVIDNAKTLNETVDFKTNGHNVDSGMVENDSEQWNKVEKSDVCDKDSVRDNGSNVMKTANKPDFHTSLSLNGLKQELADLIDDDGNLTKCGIKNVLQKAANPEDMIPVLVSNEEENPAQKSNGVISVQTDRQ